MGRGFVCGVSEHLQGTSLPGVRLLQTRGCFLLITLCSLLFHPGLISPHASCGPADPSSPTVSFPPASHTSQGFSWL